MAKKNEHRPHGTIIKLTLVYGAITATPPVMVKVKNNLKQVNKNSADHVPKSVVKIN